MQPVGKYRRALTADEVGRLLTTAPHPRSTVYLLILETALRPLEAKKLQLAGVFLAGGSLPPAGAGEGAWGGGPCVRIPMSIAKNRKTMLQPISLRLAAELRALHPEGTPLFAPVFASIPRGSTFRRDLARAGIPFLDAMGRRADLHCLRKTAGVLLCLSGAHPRVVMEFMRHSDLKLTMKLYMDAAQLQGPVAAAVTKLPWNKPTAATG
ncbi:site-specific integrase [Opitutus sp. GAS368]|uniref:site-specific integrase n=1 Tax=Opitutus sp. GAS368 TaxID=1882749 RepID=UPI000B890D65|nr:site-specific integrase [Opitutus sp. GAS368]